VEQAYARALELCRELQDASQLCRTLHGLSIFYFVRAEYTRARELGEQCLKLAQRDQDLVPLLMAHRALANAALWVGEVTSARAHCEQIVALYDRHKHGAFAFLYGEDHGVIGLSYLALALWALGYPEQALQRSHEALILEKEVSHPLSRALALFYAAMIHQCRQEREVAKGRQRRY
jgi:predicted ATPase